MKRAEVTTRLAQGGISIVTSKSPEDLATFHQKEGARFGKVIRDANIQTD